MTWLSRALKWVDMTGNFLLCNGDPASTISARTGYHSLNRKPYWLRMQSIIDHTFEPIDGQGHCRQCYHKDPDNSFRDVGPISKVTMALCVVVGCAICWPVIRLVALIERLKK